MRYKIECYAKNDGITRFLVSVKSGWGWNRINREGDENCCSIFSTREEALQAIDLHFRNQVKTKTIEYIVK